MKIRRLRRDDEEQYLALLNQFRETNISKEEWKHIWYIQNKFIIVMVHENKVIGTGSIFFEKKHIHNGTVGHIEDVVVDNRYFGDDIGTAIINFLIEEAKFRDCYKVILSCNEKIKIFYEKIGFKQTEVSMRMDLK